MPSLLRSFRWVLRLPLIVPAIIIVLVDDAFRAFVVPSVRILARLALVQRLEALVGGLPPYGILTLFLVPLAIIEPFKIYALYLLGLGHILSGVFVFFIAKVVGLGLAERLFAVGRAKLLSIAWFAWCHARTLSVRDRVHEWLSTKSFWRHAVRIAAAVREIASLWAGKAYALFGSRDGGLVAAARRRAGVG